MAAQKVSQRSATANSPESERSGDRRTDARQIRLLQRECRPWNSRTSGSRRRKHTQWRMQQQERSFLRAEMEATVRANAAATTMHAAHGDTGNSAGQGGETNPLVSKCSLGQFS